MLESGDGLASLQARAAELSAENERFVANDPFILQTRQELQHNLDRFIVTRIEAKANELQAAGVEVAGDITPRLAFNGATPQQVGVQWNRANPDAILQTVGYVESEAFQESLARYQEFLPENISQIATRAAIEGWNPLRTAQAITNAVTNLPIAYANSLMRTTQLVAARDAMAIHTVVNADILEGQIRIATLDDRTCLACLALHGSSLRIGERVDDHRQGRCVAVPVVRGRRQFWETRIGTGEAWVRGLPESEQQQLAGFRATPAKYEAWRAGAVSLQDFVQVGTDTVFGQVISESSLRGILGEAAQNYYKARN